MSRNPKMKPKMLIKETFDKTKQYFHKTLRNLKFCVPKEYQKLPKTTLPNPLNSNLDISYRSFSEKWDSNDAMKKKDDEQCSKSSINSAYYNGYKDSKEEVKASKYCGEERQESGFMAADALARKMKELEMMGMNDLDHDLDIEEVLHYYSRLKCPEYVEIVDNFFMDMYSEFSLPKPSRNNSIRKVGSTSVHSSMRSLGPIKI